MLSVDRPVKRLAILFSELAGYTIACLRELKERHGVEVLLFHWKPVKDAPFEWKRFPWATAQYARESHTPAQIERIVTDFDPQGVYVSGWMDPGYLKVARRCRLKGIPVVAGLDGQWTGSLRQRLGALAAPYHTRSAFDILWVTGERQAQLAKRLGYTGSRCWYGLYCCDWHRFARPEPPSGPPTPAFLYVGRYAREKGIADLLEAYRSYRTRAERPWELVCAGTGPLKSLLQGQEGVQDVGFVQPDHLPALLHERAGAFVLPSRHEPWGVALQEAAASRLPLVCSDACGSGVHLLQDEYNGFVFSAGDTHDLARCLARVASSDPGDLHLMGARSYELSRQFTPERWAHTLVSRLELQRY